MSDAYAVVFDERASEGLDIVGPFESREQAHDWASLDTAGGSASWEVNPLEVPRTEGARVTFDYVVKRAGSRWTDVGTDEMFEVVIKDPGSPARPMPARIVPTRMHPPGFYVAASGDTPLFAMWLMRGEDEIDMFRRFCDHGWVRLA